MNINTEKTNKNAIFPLFKAGVAFTLAQFYLRVCICLIVKDSARLNVAVTPV